MSANRCPACGGAKRFCAVCWRPMGQGDCEKCKVGDACRTCGGKGHVDPGQLKLG